MIKSGQTSKIVIFFRRPSNAGASKSLILLGKGEEEEEAFQTLAFLEVLELSCQLLAVWTLLESFGFFWILLESFGFF